ncbi:uncharacterized protein TNCV_2897921 [Trichonephila clavipes]|nr:uncharacterized protein TNCV_2897921 [Trichonephila clavipes]
MPLTKRKNKSSKLSIQKRWWTEIKTKNNMDISEYNSNVAQLSNGDSIFKNERVSMQEKSVLEQENVADTYDGPSYIIVDKNALCDIFKYTFYGSCNQSTLKLEFGHKYGFSHQLKLQVLCPTCISAKNELGETTAEYDVWYSGHKNYCQINHFGTSGAIEMKAAAKIWSRSEACGFRYTTLLSDGDVKTHKFLNSLKIYGPDVEILKEECINHVSKRLASDSLLKGCTRCLTQNSYESLHSVIWSKCSKETSAKSRRVNIAVSEAISEYNFGTLKALKEIQKAANLDLGEEAVKIAARRKKERNRQSNFAFRIEVRKDIETIKQNSTQQLQAIPKSEFQKCFEDRKHRWAKCVTANGAYFEGD